MDKGFFQGIMQTDVSDRLLSLSFRQFFGNGREKKILQSGQKSKVSELKEKYTINKGVIKEIK